MRADALALIDAAYQVDLDDQAWLRGVAAAARAVLDAGLGVLVIGYDTSDPENFRIRGSAGDGISDGAAAALLEHANFFDRAWVDAFRGVICAQVRDPRYQRFSAGTTALFEKLYRPHDINDVFSVNALDPTGQGQVILVPQPRRGQLTPSTTTKWSRIAAHIAAGSRLRRRLDLDRERHDVPDARLSPDGRVVHADGEASAKDVRERLRDSVRARERAHTAAGRRDADRAIAEWKGLIAARWSLVDQFDHDGKRFIVAQRNDPKVAGIEALTPRERCAVGYAALGHTNKLIAYEMGIAASTVAVLLSRAARRLQASSRHELIRKFVDSAHKS